MEFLDKYDLLFRMLVKTMRFQCRTLVLVCHPERSRGILCRKEQDPSAALGMTKLNALGMIQLNVLGMTQLNKLGMTKLKMF